MRSAIFIAVVLACGAGCYHERKPARSDAQSAATPSTKSISVAAASDLKFAFEEITAEFNKEHPHLHIETTFGSSGNFYSQLSNKAPFDMFFSADLDYPRRLIEQGDAARESEFLYGVGHIGIWIRTDSPLDLSRDGIAVLKNDSVKKIAIANPRFAPYGRAAEAALKHFDIYECVKDRLVIGENIAQAAHFVESGAADVGIIAASLATASPLKDKGRFWPLPSESHPTLVQGGVILSWAKDRDACEQFKSFVTSPSGQAVLKRFGFDSLVD
jgi:molybdate transport system substrate-binding protein